MSANAFVIASTTALLLGLAISVVIERFIAPIPPKTCRPLSVWSLHIGIWMMAFALMLLVTQRPFFSTVLVTAFLLLIVIIGNAKFTSLREPFTFQDFRYLSDAIRFPRLYLPFLGLIKGALIVVMIIIAIGSGMLLEESANNMWIALQTVACIALLGIAVLWLGSRYSSAPSFKPDLDIQRLGLLPSLFLYWRESRKLPAMTSPLNDLVLDIQAKQLKPNLIAIQSESFFDPRPLNSSIKKEVLSAFDRMQSTSVQFGSLEVPAWGANTVRTEFSFLSGIDNALLSPHQFNPYEAVLRGWRVGGIAHKLRNEGYRTICIHPYMASFYKRSDVFPLLGFDEFIDIQSFDGAQRSGPYISDKAVTEKIIKTIQGHSDRPLFIFVITMENHGPLHLETIAREELETYYHRTPPESWSDMSIYLRHLRNADEMIGSLMKWFEENPYPTSLCWYGDHVPIMKKVYGGIKEVPSETNFIIWNNFQKGHSRSGHSQLQVSELASVWLQESFID